MAEEYHYCVLQLGLQWSGKKGVKPVGLIKWPHDAILPQLMTAAGAMGNQWRTPCVRTADASVRPGKFTDCITDRVSV